MSEEALKVLKFLADLPLHVARESEKPQSLDYASLNKGRLSHQYVCYAIAVRFGDIDWRRILKSLHANGLILAPETFSRARIVTMSKTIDVVTDAGRVVLANESSRDAPVSTEEPLTDKT